MKRRREAAPDLFSLRCQTCNRYLVRTKSGYMACQMGHGRLIIEENIARFDDGDADYTLAMFPDEIEAS